MNAVKKKVPAVEYETCVVSFIDVLGFREIVNNRPASEVHKIIKQLEKFTRPTELDEGEPRDMSHAWAQSVSDAVVRVRTLGTEYHDGAFFHELLSLLHAQIELVNLGVFVRGGVTVGPTYVGEHGETTFFGPALIRAYEIESQEAIFPRIVVGDEALEQHRTNETLRSENNTLAYELEAIDKLLTTGEDGTRYIDYLRAAQGEVDYGGYPVFLQTHADLIRKGRNVATDPRVKRKFEWLARYHNSKAMPIRDAMLADREIREKFEAEYEVAASDFFDEIILNMP